jgi:uncharacterized membrane protein required for colicin V production
MLKWIIIILLLGIVVLCTWRGYKDGIIRGVCGILAIIIALYIAGIVARTYNSEFEDMLSPFVSGMVDSAVDKVLNDDDAVVHVTSSEKSDPYRVSYAVSRQLGLVDNAAKIIAEKTSSSYTKVNQEMCNALSDNICAQFAYVAVYFICFIIIAIVLTVIGNVINISLLIPKLGIVEPIVGAILGLIRGIILMYAVAMALRYLGIVIPGELFENSKLIFKIVNSNPVAKRVGI